MDEIKLTVAQQKALTILKDTDMFKGMSASQFADRMWGDTDTTMFTSVSNTGNGATTGKAAWLCAGSYMGKLIKKGWVEHTHNFRGYYLTPKGKSLIQC